MAFRPVAFATGSDQSLVSANLSHIVLPRVEEETAGGVHPEFGGTMECGGCDTALDFAAKKPKRRRGRRTP
jgi:hypothetical protein